MPELSRRVQTFTDSVIRRMTRINNMTPGSINLSQGFPDFDPPQEILDALKEAAEHGPHQYSITFGAKNFRDALAEMYTKKFAREIDPEKDLRRDGSDDGGDDDCVQSGRQGCSVQPIL